MALVTTACGGDVQNESEPTTAVTAPTPTERETTTSAPNTTAASAATEATTAVPVAAASTVVQISPDVPDIEMFDAATGELVSLRSVVKGEKPLMFWFWSPY